jgi:hypothetical protein
MKRADPQSKQAVRNTKMLGPLLEDLLRAAERVIIDLQLKYSALHRSSGKLNQRAVGLHCVLFLPFVPRYGSMSAHIRSTVALSTDLVMGVRGAFSENISNFTLPQFGEIASGW